MQTRVDRLGILIPWGVVGGVVWEVVASILGRAGLAPVVVAGGIVRARCTRPMTQTAHRGTGGGVQRRQQTACGGSPASVCLVAAVVVFSIRQAILLPIC